MHSNMTHNFLLDELMSTFIYLLGPDVFPSLSPQRKTFVLYVTPSDALARLHFSGHTLTLLGSWLQGSRENWRHIVGQDLGQSNGRRMYHILGEGVSPIWMTWRHTAQNAFLGRTCCPAAGVLWVDGFQLSASSGSAPAAGNHFVQGQALVRQPTSSNWERWGTQAWSVLLDLNSFAEALPCYITRSSASSSAQSYFYPFPFISIYP